MIFALLTLFTALSLAAVAGWFSIVGFMAIYAGAPIAALIMGAVTEMAKLVTISWIYRNWEYANWRLKGPLIYFTAALMVATSIGVFGFLSKGHLEQGSGTIDNSSRIETLNYQINREKLLIADNEKVIGQLDATINSFLGKDRTDKSLSVRKNQEPHRKQLRDDSDSAQKRIDALSTDKFKLESEVRKMQLEVGPIRYIAELFYGVEENATKNIEAAVRIFTLLIVSTLDPLAVILLIAANHTLLRLRNEKEKAISARKENETGEDGNDKENGASNKTVAATPPRGIVESGSDIKSGSRVAENEKAEIHVSIPTKSVVLDEEKKTVTEEVTGFKKILSEQVQTDLHEDPLDVIREVLKNTTPPAATSLGTTETVPEIGRDEINAALGKFSPHGNFLPSGQIVQPNPSRIGRELDPAMLPKAIPAEDLISSELSSNSPHFIPQRLNEKEKFGKTETKIVEENSLSGRPSRHEKNTPRQPENDKYPKALSWLSEFKRS